ncbi:unnamed protein product [Symbiodinium sp. CCMP2592]|nr:unnamed protein product [Symbiodinium sp. CCMP2592]
MCGLQHPDPDRCCFIWGSFWDKYRLVHGDEGRSKKKNPLLVISAHSILGLGSGVHSHLHDTEPYDKQELNWTGHTAATRWLLSVLPRAMYDDQRSDNYQLLLKHLVDDMKELFETGLVDPLTGHTHYFCILNIIGDWPFLAKSFEWTRTFGNSAKKATAKKAPTGICHACWADKPGYPFEDFESAEPRWRQTLNRDDPYITKPILMELPHDPADPSGFAGQDYFRGFHLGAGKIFVSSALALLSGLFPGTSFPARFKAMETDLFGWCATYKQYPYIRKFTRHTIGWPHATEAPLGGWHKGSTTLCLLRWFLFCCSQRRGSIMSGSLLYMCWEAAWEIDMFFSGIYRQKIWIEADTAKALGRRGMRFLQLNGRCAQAAFRQKLPFFQYMPNLHRLHHLFFQLVDQALEKSPHEIRHTASAAKDIGIFTC